MSSPAQPEKKSVDTLSNYRHKERTGDADLSVAVLAVLVARQVADGVGALAVGVVLARLLARAVDAGESRLGR